MIKAQKVSTSSQKAESGVEGCHLYFLLNGSMITLSHMEFMGSVSGHHSDK